MFTGTAHSSGTSKAKAPKPVANMFGDAEDDMFAAPTANNSKAKAAKSAEAEHDMFREAVPIAASTSQPEDSQETASTFTGAGHEASTAESVEQAEPAPVVEQPRKATADLFGETGELPNTLAQKANEMEGDAEFPRVVKRSSMAEGAAELWGEAAKVLEEPAAATASIDASAQEAEGAEELDALGNTREEVPDGEVTVVASECAEAAEAVVAAPKVGEDEAESSI